ncbi:MAG: hypothetical protein ACYSYW_13990 [Planctomycetota bacterium]|jgi:hypothetical protein
MVGNTNMDPIVDVELNVNGEKIELNNFVRSFILETNKEIPILIACL